MQALEQLSAEIIGCRRCPRLVRWRQQVGNEKRAAFRDWEYWARPVAGFGDPKAELPWWDWHRQPTVAIALGECSQGIGRGIGSIGPYIALGIAINLTVTIAATDSF